VEISAQTEAQMWTSANKVGNLQTNFTPLLLANEMKSPLIELCIGLVLNISIRTAKFCFCKFRNIHSNVDENSSFLECCVAVVLVQGVSHHHSAFIFRVKQFNCCEDFTRKILLRINDPENEGFKIFRNVWGYKATHIMGHQRTLEYSVFLYKRNTSLHKCETDGTST